MSKGRSISLFVFASAIFFAVVAYTFKDVDLPGLMNKISLANCAELLGIGFLFHVSFGLIMWVGFWLHYKLKMDKIEIVILPMMMHLFLYLMPVKGGLLFQVFYSKHKYKVDLSKGFSLGLMVFLNSIVLTVILGLLLAYLIPIESFVLRATIWAMGFGLLGMMVSLNLLPSKTKGGDGFLVSLTNFLINVKIQIGEQSKNVKLFFGLFITSFLSVTIQAVWFWKTAEILGIESNFAAVYLVVLILRVVLLIRLVPGNLGIQEVIIGVVFAAAGFEIEEGLLIGVITRIISVIWTALIGLPALYSNLKHFNSMSLSGLINKVSQTNK